MRTVRIGLIGTGSIASDGHAPALSATSDAAFWSVLSRDQKRAIDFAARFGALSPAPAFSDLELFLRDPLLDAVIIASPDKLHASQVLACIEHGKHVLVEKPFVTDTGEGKEILAAADRAGVKIGVAFHLRWHSGLRSVHSQFVSGVFGKLVHINLHWSYKACDPTNWRASDELGRWWSLAATGSHCIDLIMWFNDASREDILSRSSITSSPVLKGKHDEISIGAYRFRSGSTASFFSSVLFNSTTKADFYFENANVNCVGVLGRKGHGDILINNEMFKYTPVNPFQAEIADFVDSILRNREPEVPGKHGLFIAEEMCIFG